MTRSRPITFLACAAVVPLAALAVAGCGGGNNNNNNNKPIASSAPPKTASARSATVSVGSSSLGKILVDSQGRTLYLFNKDSGTTSECAGACASAWPPLRANGRPRVGSGANASLVGTTARSDGGPQVTYNGHPLYLFVMDKKPGDVNGEGVSAFGGSWFALSAAGNQVSPPAPQAPPPAPKASPPPSNNGIPQNGGGDGDADNSGGPDDGDGGV